MSIRYSPEADEDLSRDLRFIAGKNPLASEHLYDKLTELLTKLEAREFDGPEKTLRTGDLVRAWPSEHWWVYYQRHGEELYVLRIYHQARKPIARRQRRRKK